MKKYILIILAVILLTAVGLFYYLNQGQEKATTKRQDTTNETVKKDVREAVWEQMSDQQKAEIIGTWQDGKVSRITWSDGAVMRATVNKSYVGQAVYVITFPSNLNATIGDVVVFADVNTFDIIGYGLRD